MSQPLIAIIITVLNGAKTIEKCLTSIANQTFQDYELIIVDGGSNDQTLEIINSIHIKNITINVFPGSGLYEGLNAGVKLSTAKWLYFIGADDELYDPNTLTQVAKVLYETHSNVKVVVGNVNCERQGLVLKPLFGSPYFMRHHVHHQGMFYCRTVFSKMLYNERMKIASDYEYNIMLALSKVPHKAMNVMICNFGGDGVSENQLMSGYYEMQQVHRNLFTGVNRHWVVNYFWFRRTVGKILRRHNFISLRRTIKNIFG